jgi:hypothetical protein
MMLSGGVTELSKEIPGSGMKSKKCEQLWSGEKWKLQLLKETTIND